MNARQKAKKYKRKIVALKCMCEILQRNNNFLRLHILTLEELEQPNIGKWIINNNDDAGEGFYICSNCKNDVYDITDFCPNCGADMRERADKEWLLFLNL